MWFTDQSVYKLQSWHLSSGYLFSQAGLEIGISDIMLLSEIVPEPQDGASAQCFLRSYSHCGPEQRSVILCVLLSAFLLMCFAVLTKCAFFIVVWCHKWMEIILIPLTPFFVWCTIKFFWVCPGVTCKVVGFLNTNYLFPPFFFYRFHWNCYDFFVKNHSFHHLSFWFCVCVCKQWCIWM